MASLQGDLSHLRQGDWLELLWVPRISLETGGPEKGDAPHGVVIVSQTCDVVQASGTKKCVAVAPLVTIPREKWREVAKGKTPTLIPVDLPGSNVYLAADLTQVVAVPKAYIENLSYQRWLPESEVSGEARRFAERVGRAYTRYPYPDELHPLFLDARSRIYSKSDKLLSPFGKILESVETVRIQAKDWSAGQLELTLYFIVRSDLLVSDDRLEASADALAALPSDKKDQYGSLDGVERALAEQLEKAHQDPQSVDKAILRALFMLWSQRFYSKMIEPKIRNNPRVASVEIEVLNGEEFCYDNYRVTESFDLDVLSQSGD